MTGLLDSLKVRLGLLVAASVLVASGLSALAGAAGVAPLLVVPVAVAVALLVTQLLATGMVAPLREMTAAARAMAQGRYGTPVTTSGRGEVGELARAFTAMASDLAAEDHQRRALVANVSHELRTPVAALHAVLENLADGVVPADDATLAVALGQTERLSTLVRDLLDLGRLDAGLATLDLQPVRVRAAYDGVVAEADHLARGVRYVIDAPDDLVVPADPARLHQLLANLVDNAARHSPPGGTVTLRGRVATDAVLLEVVDQGPGIAAEERERVFDRFVTSAEPGAGGGGTGLGLAVARWVAVLHGGRIEAAAAGADAPDAPTAPGALLRVTLPDTPGAPLPPEPLPAAAAPAPTTGPLEDTVTTVDTPPTVARPAAPPATGGPTLTWWPERLPQPRPRLLVAALVVGSYAAIGAYGAYVVSVGYALLLVAMVAVAVWPARHRLDRADRAAVALAVLLAGMAGVRAAEWVVVLCTVAAGGLVTATLVGSRTLAQVFASGALVPLAGLRGLPWLGRTVEASVGRTSWRAARTAVVSLLLLLVVGGLLASADAVFAGVVDAVLPDVELGETVPRLFVALVVAGIVLAGAYTALNPPALDALDRTPASGRRWEWFVPVAVLDALLGVFLVGQAAALFGGEAFVGRTTGLTYAEYARTGFGQMVVVTLLVLAVVSWAVRRVAAADRPWARGSLGLLVTLTLLVVVSALHRMATYEDAFGLTRLRLLVFVFEGWLGLVLAFVLVGGLLWKGRWLARTALLTGAATLLVLALANPDARIAERNLSGDPGVTGLDESYLTGLSQDALPVLPPRLRGCAALAGGSSSLPPDDGLSWNLGRWRAEASCR